MADDQGIMGAFSAPKASTEMFAKLADKTNMFGDSALGAVNRAIVGAPIDAIDLMGRIGETALRGAAKAGEGIASALGAGEGMSRRFGRDVYGLGLAATTIAPTAPVRPRGKSNKTLVLEAQKEKVKSPIAKEKLDQDMEIEAISDALKDASSQLDETLSVQSNIRDTEMYLNSDDFGDVLLESFARQRASGKSRGEAMVDAMKDTEAYMSEANMMDVTIDQPIRDTIFKRLDDDYGFAVNKAIKRREEAAANQAALKSRAFQARKANQPPVDVEAAIRQQQELINLGIPQPAPTKPAFTVIEGGLPSKKKIK